MIDILLVEDHAAVREGLRLLLGAHAGMRVVGEAGDGAAALELARQVRPDVITLDLSLPGMSGFEVARRLRVEVPASGIVVLSRHHDPSSVQEMLALGVSGYVRKQSFSRELLNAILAAAEGRRYIDASLASPPTSPAHPASVTPRERDVLHRAAAGLSNKEIASALGVSVKTVEVHKANGMQKLGLQSRADLVRYASLNGWLDNS